MVEVPSLPLMASGYVGSPDDGPMAATHPTAAPPPELDMAAAQVTDIVATLECSAELRYKGILSEEAFATTKAELLYRLSAAKRA
jgi:hypothetical protein